jgi:hypothetical protein
MVSVRRVRGLRRRSRIGPVVGERRSGGQFCGGLEKGTFWMRPSAWFMADIVGAAIGWDLSRPKWEKPAGRIFSESRSMSHCFRILAFAVILGTAVFPAACSTIPDKDASIFEIRAASIDPMDGWTKSERVIGGTRVWISPDIVVDASGVFIAEPIVDDQDRNAVLIDLDDAATEALLEFTSGWLSKPVAVFVDGRIVTTPILNATLSRKFVIAGAEMTKEQADDLARRLRQSD